MLAKFHNHTTPRSGRDPGKRYPRPRSGPKVLIQPNYPPAVSLLEPQLRQIGRENRPKQPAGRPSESEPWITASRPRKRSRRQIPEDCLAGLINRAMNTAMIDREFTLRAPRYALLSSSQECWQCHRTTPVVGFLVPTGHEALWVDDDPDQDEWERQDCASIVSNISHLEPSALAQAQALSPHYGPGRTKTGGSYLMNSCANCRAAQGDFFLYSEPDGAFFPTSTEGLARIRVIPIDEPFACNGNSSYGSVSDEISALAW